MSVRSQREGIRRAGRVAPLLVLALLGACSPLRVVSALSGSGSSTRRESVPYGDEPRQRLDVYRPRSAPARAPLLVFLYGGSWKSGDKAQYAFVAEAFTSRGFVVVIADYRLYPAVRFPAFVEDAARAVAWAREHAAQLGADPARVFVAGHSAGAHLAMLLALDARYLGAHGLERSSLAGVIGLAGPYDFLPFKSEDVRGAMGPEPGWPQTQPIAFVDGAAPPALLIHGTRDETVRPRNSVRLARRYRQEGACVTLVLLPGAGHVSVMLALAPALGAFTPDVLPLIEAFVAAPTCGARPPRPHPR